MALRSLILIETLGETQCILKQPNLIAQGEILCFSPNIRAYLLDRGIKTLSTSEITDAHFHQKVMGKCTQLEGMIEKELLDKPEEYFVRAYLHYLRLIWRHFLWNIEMLDALLSTRKYQKVHAFVYPQIRTRSPWIEDDQLYVGELAKRVCAEKGIHFSSLIVEHPAEDHGQINYSAFDRMCDLAAGCFLMLALSGFAPGKKLLVPSLNYNLGLVVDELTSAKPGLKVCQYYEGRRGIMGVLHAIKILIHSRIRTPVKEKIDLALPILTLARYFEKGYDPSNAKTYLWQTLGVLDKAEGQTLIYKNVKFYDLFRFKVAEDLIPYMLDMHFKAYGLIKGVELIKPDLILSQMAFEITGALGYAAKKFNIPSVLISHGSHTMHTDEPSAREHEILAKNIMLADYQYCALQSPHARRLAEALIDDPGRLVNIRPTLWGRNRVKQKKADRRLTLLHAGTFKLRHNRRFIYETSDEFVQGLTDLCETVANLPNLRLILKLRSDPFELSLDSLKKLLPLADNIEIETEKSFIDALGAADVLISFSSTTIEEALNNHIPVLLYGGQGRYAHIPVGASDKISGALSFAPNKASLKKMLTELNEKYLHFEVAREQFTPHIFSEQEVVDFTPWFLGRKEKV